MKKHITLLLLALAVVLGAKAQQNYTEFWHNADSVHRASRFVEDDNGNLVVCTSTRNPNNMNEYKDLILYTFTKDGRVVDSVIVDYMNPDSYYFLEKDPNPNDDCTILFGLVYHEDGKSVFRLLKLDDYLQTVEQFDICFFDGISQRETFLLDPYNSIILYWNDSEKANYFARIGINGEIIDTNSFEPLEFDNLFSTNNPLAIYSTDPLQYSLSYDSEFPGYQYRNGYMVVDSLFNLVGDKILESEFDGFMLYPGDRSFYVREFYGRHFLLVDLIGKVPPLRHYLEIVEVDKSFNILKRFRFHNHDLGEHSVAVKSFIPAAEGGFYFSCYSLQYGNRIYAAKLDNDLNLEWERWCLESVPEIWFVGLDMQALSDGGVGLCGAMYNYGNTPMPLKFWCVTIEDTGTAVPEAEPYIRPYLIYPNPVKDRLSIQFSPDVKPESIELYDIAGCCVASTRAAEMDVANLPAGQYVAKIALEGGKTYTDKIVKE